MFTSNRRPSSWLQIIGWQTISLKLHVLLWFDNKEGFGVFSPLDACLFFVILFVEQFLENPALFYSIAPSSSVSHVSEKQIQLFDFTVSIPRYSVWSINNKSCAFISQYLLCCFHCACKILLWFVLSSNYYVSAIKSAENTLLTRSI